MDETKLDAGRSECCLVTPTVLPVCLISLVLRARRECEMVLYCRRKMLPETATQKPKEQEKEPE